MTQTSPEDRFVAALGLMAQAEGVTRIAGQIVAYLTLEGEPRSLTEIATALDVSKASVSTNVRHLELRGTARRVSNKGSRQDLWAVSAKPHRGMLLDMSVRFERNAETIEEIAESFPATQTVKRDRVRDHADFYRDSATFLKSWAEQLKLGAAETVPSTTISHGTK
ncbi:GbsR/MarR family transcriptional regulator [Pseudooceanicola sp. C21-150M6]|uniref:GbsR/MarR family transcriptional regulator n=1 Tax=Pseudooceanicola sp. C21-150M6 TaxID=3434355 RepID=UPI003D7F7C31